MSFGANPGFLASPGRRPTAPDCTGFRIPIRIPGGWRLEGSVDGGPAILSDSSGEWTVAITGPKGSPAVGRERLALRLAVLLNSSEGRR